jgi:hypothetical protein
VCVSSSAECVVKWCSRLSTSNGSFLFAFRRPTISLSDGVERWCNAGLEFLVRAVEMRRWIVFARSNDYWQTCIEHLLKDMSKEQVFSAVFAVCAS